MNNSVHRRVAVLCCFLGMCLLATGCMRWDITLNNGDIIRAKTKPKRNAQGYYVFKDLAGQQTMINYMRVRQIEPVRAGSEPAKPF